MVDTAWSEDRAASYGKESIQRRELNGREFEMYKKYLERKDFDILAERYHVDFSVTHEGGAYIVAVGTFF